MFDLFIIYIGGGLRLFRFRRELVLQLTRRDADKDLIWYNLNADLIIRCIILSLRSKIASKQAALQQLFGAAKLLPLFKQTLELQLKQVQVLIKWTGNSPLIEA